MKSLKQARMSKGVTKKAMAEHLGISGPTYDVYEDHPDRMRIETAKKAADFLGYKPEEIFWLC
ncbi:MAG: helix-turn-helix transcriptional regulator [Collinsella sp.]|nr:helix-turn-helix transcriptional regulator [Collinsella sp.]